MSSETKSLGSQVDSIDLAALLLAYNFPLVEANVVETVSLDSVTRPEDRGKMTSWRFGARNPSGMTVDSVRQKWELPRKGSCSTIAIARLLAHNHAVLRHLATCAQAYRVEPLEGGLGILHSGEGEPIGNRLTALAGESTCDTDAMALCITLGVRGSLYIQGGQLRGAFYREDGKVSLRDVLSMLRDSRLRAENNLSMCAVLVCMLDNRKVILENMHAMRKKVRLTQCGGQVQALFTEGSLSREQKLEIERHFE